MSAVIYAAIVVMWAVVLVPMWLRRHDAATESRSVDRFSTAMRTLSRRTTAAPGRRYVVMPRRSDGVTVHVSGAAAVKRPPQRSVERPAQSRPAQSRPAQSRPPRRRASLVARRRRWLLVLLAVTALTFLAACIGVVSWPLQLVVDVVLVAFCIHLRNQVRRSAAAARRPTATATRRPAPTAARPAAAGPAAPAPVQREVPAAAAFADTVGVSTEPITPVVDEPALPATGTDGGAADDDATWEPVPVPRPTYTMKPPAPAFEADPTYTDPVYTPASAPAAPRGDDDGVSDLDEILERRWAVND